MRKLLLSFVSFLFFLPSFAQLSTEGREFWVGFMDIIPNGVPQQKLYITSRTNTIATITVGNILAPSYTETVNITADAITTVTLPQIEVTNTENEQIVNKGVRIVSPNLISVFASHEDNARTESSVVLPVNSLGNNPEYLVTGYFAAGPTAGNASEFLIVGVEDGAQVQITPSCTTSTGRPAGQPFTITLSRGQVYQVQAQVTPNGTPVSSLNLYDLTGSRIVTTNCKRIAVFAGVNATFINPSCGTPQHVYEQIFPLQAWGRDYVVAPLATSTNGYVCRIMASENGTNLTFDGAPYTLQSGQFLEFDVPSASPRCISANKPIAVTQFMKGTQCNGANGGDPAMVVLNPVTQTIKKITYPTIPRGTTSVNHYINVITKQINKDKIRLNGNLIPASSFTNVCNNYAYASINTQSGIGSQAFTLQSDSSFIAYAYGYSPNEGYAFSVGGAFENDQYNFLIPEQVCVNTPLNIRGFGINISSYSWDFGNGQTATGQNVTVTYTTPGFYDIKMTVTIIGAVCIGEVTKTIQVVPFPVVNIGGDRVACPGGTVTLSAGTHPLGTTYLWSNGATTPTVNVGVGSYFVIVRSPAGCETISNTVNVTPLPSLTLTMNVGTNYCTSSPPFTMVGTPAGGVFRINGVMATVFNPALIGVGTHTVTYTIPGGDGCDHVLSRQVQISTVPFANFSLASTFCLNSNPVTLVGTPAGGVFTINGVPATVFDPAAVGVGLHEVVYTINPSPGCSSSTIRLVRVNDAPVITFTNVQPQYCIGANSFTIQATPAGGVIRINGNVNNVFNPTALGIGTHTISYTIPPANGCAAATREIQVQIVNTPEVDILGLKASYCTNDADFLPTGSPAGGEFYIGGNPITSIKPSVLGPGNFTLEYRYTNITTQCQGKITKNFQIFAAPTDNNVSFVGLNDRYCYNSPAITLQASPAGGTFKVEGVVTNVFNPALFGSGVRKIEYTYQNANGCSHTIQKEVIITPQVTYTTNIKNIHCTNDGIIKPTILPNVAGTFTLNGEIITEIDFSKLTAGNYILKFVANNDQLACNVFEKSFQVIQAPPSQEIPAIEVCTNKGDIATLKAPEGGTSYLWNTGATTQEITVDKPGKYRVKVFTGVGDCSAETIIEVKEVCDTQIHLPTAFTPNGDGLNDTLEIFGFGFDSLEVWIYNQWGELVFLRKGIDQKIIWDGTVGGKEAPAGVYVCKVRYREFQNKFLSEKVQTLTLIR
ncbi:MAG: gliding motility-associated C-terminal domain-containing protein [Microscillaceae bacterium]|nr:gliding motility-associated C-terminal domain-containing protein [Microscillaceae bacterium]MDW8460806.1 gliding motility-associated C-terminal domain-containing protein [Cytophagales bacterium]